MKPTDTVEVTIIKIEELAVGGSVAPSSSPSNEAVTEELIQNSLEDDSPDLCSQLKVAGDVCIVFAVDV